MVAGFSGEWEDDEGLVVRVEGASAHGAPHVAVLHMPGGAVLELLVLSRSTCSFESEGEVYKGTLADDGESIAWSDAGTWLRKLEARAEASPAAVSFAEAKAAPGVPADLAALRTPLVQGNGPILLAAQLSRGSRKGSGKSKAPAAASLTLAQAISLQDELYDAFSDDGFQRKLSEVEQAHGRAYESCTEAHEELFLSVHRELLPAYGFEGTAEGVRAMLAAAARHSSNADFCRNRLLLNRLLGLEPPGGEAQPSPGEEEQGEHESTGQGAKSLPAGRVRVTVRHAVDGSELQVMVPESASHLTVKEALAKKVGRAEVLTKGRFVGEEDGRFVAHKDHIPIGDAREVMVLGVSLEVHDDAEAKACRHELMRRQRASK